MNEPIMVYRWFPVLIFFGLAGVSYVGVHLIRHWLERRRVLDVPNARSSHSIPTPRGGGMAIVALTLAVGLFAGACTQRWRECLVYVGMGLVVAWLGWQDDKQSISPRWRFLIQGIVAAVTILSIGYFRSVTVPLFGTLNWEWVGIPMTFIWIIGLINAYNFMDGIDGIAGGVALIGGLGWMVLSSSTGGVSNITAYWIALGMAASSLGFLGHNWSPARIFMGDVASTFLGYTFAVLPLFSISQERNQLLLGTTILWAFILDTLVTFIVRAIKREKILSAHRSHLYQRLVIAGWSHAQVTFLYMVLTLIGCVLTYGWNHAWIATSAFIIIGLPVSWIILSIIAAVGNHGA
jgi:Fuc2NAc and GlcNAc transferase